MKKQTAPDEYETIQLIIQHNHVREEGTKEIFNIE